MHLILLPGIDGTGDLFNPMLPFFSGKLTAQVVRYPNDRVVNLAALVQHVLRELPAIELFVLLGESFSGPIAISVAASNPPNLAGIILCASFARAPMPRLARLAATVPALLLMLARQPFAWRLLLGRFAATTVDLLIISAMRKLSPEVLSARLQDVSIADVTSQLAEIRVPMLYLKASRDQFVPRAASELVCAINPDVEVRKIDGRHFLLQVLPQESAERILSFCFGLTR